MTSVEFNRLARETGPHHTHGWVVSLLCHMLGVGSALLVMAEIEKPILPKPFHWEVAMVEPPGPVEPAPAEPAPASPDHRPANRTAEPPPRVKPVVPVQRVVREAAPTVETREPAQQAVPTIETREPVHQTAREIVTQNETSMERPVPQTAESHAVIARAVTSSRGAVVEQVASQAADSFPQERAEPVETRTVVQASPQPRQLEPFEMGSQPVESVSSTIEHRVVQQRVVQLRQTQADYGWLAGAIRGRIEELKHYPVQARINHWEGKVVVEAVIRDDGTVVGLKVAESSGRDILDQEALTVMKKASPLTLKHPLGKPQVTILVPISYRLDG